MGDKPENLFWMQRKSIEIKMMSANMIHRAEHIARAQQYSYWRKKRKKKRTNAKEISEDKIKEKFSGLSSPANRANPIKKKERKKDRN